MLSGRTSDVEEKPLCVPSDLRAGPALAALLWSVGRSVCGRPGKPNKLPRLLVVHRSKARYLPPIASRLLVIKLGAAWNRGPEM